MTETDVWASLGNFRGSTKSFWEKFLVAAGQSLNARRVVLLRSAVGKPWTALAQWPSNAPDSPDDASDIILLTERLVTDAPILRQSPDGRQIIGLRLPQADVGLGQVAAIVAFTQADDQISQRRLQLWAEQALSATLRYTQSTVDLPATICETAPNNYEAAKAERLFQLLQLSIRLFQQPNFFQMASELCNTLAARLAVDRVSLGWREASYVRLVAVSHIEKFDPQSAASRALETAMEEAADQAAMILFPPNTGSRGVHRAHESYSLMQGAGSVVSMPLLDGSEVLGIMFLESLRVFYGTMSFGNLVL